MRSLEGQQQLQDFNNSKETNIKAQTFSSQGLAEGQRQVLLPCFRHHLVNQLGPGRFFNDWIVLKNFRYI